MDVKDIDFQKLTIDQLKQLRLESAIELSDRKVKINALAEDTELSIARYQRLLEPKPETPQAIAARSEAEISNRAEALLKSATGQRVII